jgi:hypothetical protein
LRRSSAGGHGGGARLGLADQRDDLAVDRGIGAEPFRQPHQLAVDKVDLGLAASREIIGHRRARLGVDLPRLHEEIVEQPVGGADHPRQHPRTDGADLGGLDAGLVEQAQPLAHRTSENAPIVALAQLLEQRPARQGADRVVEVDQELAPRKAEHIVRQFQRSGGSANSLRQLARFRAVVGIEIARDPLMEAPVPQIGDIVGHHPSHDGEALAKLALQHLDIADPVLEADHHRTVAATFGDLFRRVGGRPALDAQRDDARIGQCVRFGPIVDQVRGKEGFPAAIVGQRQTVLADVRREARTADEADVEPGRLPATADEAADRPGAEDRNPGQPRPR